MKYIKLFEDFKDSGNMSNELIQLLNEYKTDLEQNPIQPEKIQNYLDTLLTVNADIKKYDEITFNYNETEINMAEPFEVDGIKVCGNQN